MSIYEVICLILLVAWSFWLSYRVDELEDKVCELEDEVYRFKDKNRKKYEKL